MDPKDLGKVFHWDNLILFGIFFLVHLVVNFCFALST